MKKNIIAIGGQGFLKECIFYLKKMKNVTFKGFVSVDNFVPNIGNFQKYYLGDLSQCKVTNDDYFVICAGSPELRKYIYYILKKKNYNLTNLIYNSEINNSVSLGDGNVFINCDITVDITIGNGNLFNNRSMIYHDSVIGDFNCFAPMCQILGHSKIASNNNIGTGVILFPKSKIGNNCKIAAGSAIYKYCKDNCVYMGNPAAKVGCIE